MNQSTKQYYRPPEAALTDDSIGESVTAKAILARLVFEQSFVRVFIATFFGVVLGVVVLALFLVTPGILFLAYALPGIITGMVVRYAGKALDVRYRLFSGAVALVLYWALIEFLNPSSTVFGLSLSVVNALVAGALCRRSLEPEEEAAVYYRRMGISRSPE